MYTNLQQQTALIKQSQGYTLLEWLCVVQTISVRTWKVESQLQSLCTFDEDMTMEEAAAPFLPERLTGTALLAVVLRNGKYILSHVTFNRIKLVLVIYTLKKLP